MDFLKQNTTLNDLDNKLKQEKDKLEKVKKLENTKTIYSNQTDTLIENIFDKNNQFETKIEDLKNSFSSQT